MWPAMDFPHDDNQTGLSLRRPMRRLPPPVRALSFFSGLHLVLGALFKSGHRCCLGLPRYRLMLHQVVGGLCSRSWGFWSW